MFEADPRLFIESYLSKSAAHIAANSHKYWSCPALVVHQGVPQVLADDAGLAAFFTNLARFAASARGKELGAELVELSTPLPNMATAVVRRHFRLNPDEEPLSALVHYTLRWNIEGWRFYSAIAQTFGEILPGAIHVNANQG